MDKYLQGDNKNCVQVDKNGNGLQRLWKQQLMSFPLSSLETAEAICMQYSSFKALAEVSINAFILFLERQQLCKRRKTKLTKILGL